MSTPSTAAKGLTVGVFVVILGAVATNGAEAIASARGGWLFLTDIAKGLPLGVWSVLLGLGIGVGLLWNLRVAIPEPTGSAHRGAMHGRLALIEPLAMASTLAAIWLQLRSLNGALIGLGAALFVPPLYRLLAAFLSWLGRRYSLR